MATIPFGSGTVNALARTHLDWVRIKTARTTPFVRCLADWDEFVATGGIQNTPLKRLGKADLMVFRGGLHFDEISRNGAPYSRCCASWYYGDLVEKHGFTGSELEEVAAIFGISPERFQDTKDKFGDICDDEVCCRPRPNFNCPGGKPDCEC